MNFYIPLQKVSRPIGWGRRCKLFMLNDISFDSVRRSETEKRSNDTNHNRKCVEMHLKLN